MNSKHTPERMAAKKYPWLMNETVGNVKIEHKREAYATCIREQVEPLEEEVERLRVLVQELVDSTAMLRVIHAVATGYETLTGIDGLASAKEMGFVPTNTEDK